MHETDPQVIAFIASVLGAIDADVCSWKRYCQEYYAAVWTSVITATKTYDVPDDDDPILMFRACDSNPAGSGTLEISRFYGNDVYFSVCITLPGSISKFEIEQESIQTHLDPYPLDRSRFDGERECYAVVGGVAAIFSTLEDRQRFLLVHPEATTLSSASVSGMIAPYRQVKK